MDAGLIGKVETGIEMGASALFAAAVGYAGYGLFATIGLQPQLGLAVGALAFLPSLRLLNLAGQGGDTFSIAVFTPRDFEFAEAPEELLLTERLEPTDELVLTERLDPSELVLTDADRVDAAIPLVLDQILEEIGPQSRVVRLFDRKAMPTAGELQSRVAKHLEDGTPLHAPSSTPASMDASQALSAALAELRRSLR